MMVGQVYMSGLNQTGPPPGANNTRMQFKGYYICPTLADLRRIETNILNETDYPLAILQGQDERWDGLLQGWYQYIPEGAHLAQADDGGSWVIVNDGNSAWKKFT
jgi:hypothetical protein